jgi:hypothetical protein
MNENKLMAILWVGLFCLVPILVLALYNERSEYSKQCGDANGTLIMTKSGDYICIKTKAIIPIK